MDFELPKEQSPCSHRIKFR